MRLFSKFCGTSSSVQTVKEAVDSDTTPAAWRVPWQLKTAGQYSGYLILVGIVAFFGWQLFLMFSEVTIPLMVGLLFTAILYPATTWLRTKGLPKILSVALPMILMVAALFTLFGLVGTQIASQFYSVGANATRGLQTITEWLRDNAVAEKLGISTDSTIQHIQGEIGNYASKVFSSIASAGLSVGHFLAGTVLALFATFFFLYDGKRIVNAFANWLRKPVRAQLSPAAHDGWKSLVHYVRAIVIVAAVNGSLVGLGAAVLGSDVFLSIGCITFIMSFIPLLGAVISGAVAFLVVLVTLGFTKAVIMLLIYVIVNQIEGNVLHPFLLGKSVDLHPLLVLVGIAVGFTLDGALGALFIVPIMAFVSAFVKNLRKQQRA